MRQEKGQKAEASDTSERGALVDPGVYLQKICGSYKQTFFKYRAILLSAMTKVTHL